MTRKIYRTAMGKMVDLGSMQLQNENTRAVGNMGVNARGDLLDSQNRPIRSKNQQVAKQYSRQVSNVQDSKVYSTNNAVPDPREKPKTAKRSRKTGVAAPAPGVADPVIENTVPVPPEDFDDNFVKEETQSAPSVQSPVVTGLAAAIARSRQIKQEPLKTPQQIAKEQGVRKL